MKILRIITAILFAVGLVLIVIGFLRRDPAVSPPALTELPSNELVLYYNQDFVAEAPLSWQDVKHEIVRLKREFGEEIPAIALGRAENVAYASEIFVLLLQQQGGSLADLDSEAALFTLQFLKEFTDPGKTVYTWDSSDPGSLQAFANGQVVMVLARQSDASLFTEVNYALAPFPKIDPNQAELAWPILSDQTDVIIRDAIEQVALGYMSPQQALTVAQAQLE